MKFQFLAENVSENELEVKMKMRAANLLIFDEYRVRTDDLLVNSQTLYLLS